MNITTLARKLRIATKELKILLPELGFDIGQKAIKVDDQVAQKIIKDWRRLIAEYQAKLSLSSQSEAKAIKQNEDKTALMPVMLGSQITVKEFAEKLNIPLNVTMRELIKNGIMISLNEPIDFDTASIIAEDLGRKIKREETETGTEEHIQKTVADILKAEKPLHKLRERPPVIVVMGHVDHGKTKLLDCIRESNIAEKEAGGITQHIGAYQIKKNNEWLTFIDTPGHEAFTAMRTRGSKVADLAILVVAADDSIQPQTLEAIRIIKNNKLPMLVAINKIDKPNANIERVKKDLAANDLLPEDWGGKTICVPISAKTGEGIDKLLETILLLKEIDKEKLLTDWERLPVGTIIESNLSKTEGPIATMLVQAGTLAINQILSINEIFYGKVKQMQSFLGETIESVTPGMAVKIVGLKAVPAVGEIVEVKKTITGLSKKIKIESREQIMAVKTAFTKNDEEEEEDVASLHLVLKTDTLGSSEVILESVAKLNLPADFKIDFIQKALGNINESDLTRAETANAIIVGFHVKVPTQLQQKAKEKDIIIRCFTIIYELIDFLKEEIGKIATPETTKKEVGKTTILKNFKQTKNTQIIGGKVTKGEIKANQQFDIIRNKTKIGEGTIIELQSNKEEVTVVALGEEYGAKIKSLILIEEKDELLIWELITKEVKL